MLLLLSTLLAAAPLSTSGFQSVDTVRTVNGVSMPETIDVEGHTLYLNGMALRKKAIFKVYVAALYVGTRSASGPEILSADEPRRMIMHFVRNVGKDKICDAWEDGLKDNTPDASPELKQQFTDLCGMMADIKNGQAFVFTYEPGKGTTVVVAGETRGTIGDKAFADAMLRTWIGPKPGPGEGFKKDLLGKS